MTDRELLEQAAKALEQHERKKAYLREWYAKNREKQLAAVKKWQQENKERANTNKRAYAERHPDRIKESQRKHYTKPEVLARQRGDPARLEYCRQRGAKIRESLSDEYVRRVMAQHLSIKGSELPQSLVDAHREVMKIKRYINEKRQ